MDVLDASYVTGSNNVIALRRRQLFDVGFRVLDGFDCFDSFAVFHAKMPTAPSIVLEREGARQWRAAAAEAARAEAAEEEAGGDDGVCVCSGGGGSSKGGGGG
jgi:hypothetical protein